MNRKTLLIMLMALASVFQTSLASDKWPVTGILPAAERPNSGFSADPHREFDFWIGEWDVNLRIRQADLSWQDRVAARVFIYPILNGKAILELWDSKPIKGYSLRYYDPAEENWQLWLNWPGRNSTNSSTLQGAFRHGRGDFFSRYVDLEGNAVIKRFSFNDIYPDSLRWDDHISTDGGDTWRDNWRMEWTRTAAMPIWPIAGKDAHTYDDGSRCDEPEFRKHEPLAGRWTGTFTQQNVSRDAELLAYRILDGCAVMVFARSEGREWFWLNVFDTGRQRWSSQFLSDRRSSALVSFLGDESDFRFVDSANTYRQEWNLAGDRLEVTAAGGADNFILNVRRQ